MLPGNRPEDLAVEDQGEAEGAFYERCLRFYGLGSPPAVAFRAAFLLIDEAAGTDWMDDAERRVEADEVRGRLDDIEASLFQYDHDELPDAKVEKARLLDRLRVLCTHNLQHNAGHGNESWSHESWCPDRVKEAAT
jgi:hypothetical protein